MRQVSEITPWADNVRESPRNRFVSCWKKFGRVSGVFIIKGFRENGCIGSGDLDRFHSRLRDTISSRKVSDVVKDEVNAFIEEFALMDREGDNESEEDGDDNGDEVIYGDGVSDEYNSDGEESGNDVSDDEESRNDVSDDKESGDGVSDDDEDDSEPGDDNIVICKAARFAKESESDVNI